MRYIYSACVVIETPDVAILCDPWFTEGAYDGSWYHFPKVNNPLDVIGDVDCIFISHIHPDHYDPEFLRSYEARFGQKRIIVAPRAFPYLERSLKASGFQVEADYEALRIGDTSITAIPIRPEDPSEIDSALYVVFEESSGKKHSVLNVNDVVFDDQVLSELSKRCVRPDILLLGYTGAGPYPQTYFDLDDPRLVLEAEKKKKAFFERYARNIQAFDAKVNIPFAGKYVLGGEINVLNDYRGVADAVEILSLDSRAIVLADSGGKISTADMKPTAIRTEPYERTAIVERYKEISRAPMTYELIDKRLIPLIPFEPLLRKAFQRAQARSAVEGDYFFVIYLPEGRAAELNANKTSEDGFRMLDDRSNLPTPRSEIAIDPRYLFGLLSGVFHWNTAEVGSQYTVRRYPNVFNRQVQQFLNFLSV